MAWINVNQVNCCNIANLNGLGKLPAYDCSEVVFYNPSATTTYYATTNLTAPLSGYVAILPNQATTVYGMTSSDQVSAVTATSTNIYAVAKFYACYTQPW